MSSRGVPMKRIVALLLAMPGLLLGQANDDVLWYLSQVATEAGLDLEEIAAENLDKLFSRQERGVLRGSGDDR